ncbi:MAG: DMT family transporter [Desulfurococcales archaeon]|nr:DMT family transporter [Desulfurococcales archaeon]
MKVNPSKAFLVALWFVAWLSISASSILVILSRQTSLVCAFWRLLFSLPLVAFASYFSGGPKHMSLRELLLACLAGVFLAFHFLTWMTSLHLTSVALSTTLVVLYPLIAAVVEVVLHKASITKESALGLVLSVAGAAISLAPSFSTGYWLGPSLALMGAFLAAGYFLIGSEVRRAAGLWNYVLVAYASAALALGIYGGLAGDSLFPSSSTAWFFLVALALVPMIGGHTTMNYMLKYMPTYSVTSVALGEPVGASLIAWAVLNQKPGINVWVGMLLVLMGEWLVLRVTGNS